jgi:hypothetical protein
LVTIYPALSGSVMPSRLTVALPEAPLLPSMEIVPVPACTKFLGVLLVGGVWLEEITRPA